MPKPWEWETRGVRDARLDQLHSLGFTKSARYREDDGRFSAYISVGCESCQAVVINGLPCHETGCPVGRRVRAEQEE